VALRVPARLHETTPAMIEIPIAKLASKLSGRKACIGVKKLLGLIDMVKQTDPRSRVNKLLSKLEEENFIDLVA